ncbi:uncharacterized protein LOC107365184 [Tetranychus urticae]|uniref:Gustatory receptor n=1 Tax=Tetranychus urticae TaxID=32264 RepID=T1KL09_TETUR|nr:uncharacterized protein LOC107365184 [Tetranychus urticae]
MKLVKSLTDPLVKMLDRQLSPESLRPKVRRLEKMGKITKTCVLGYAQKGRMGRLNHTLHTLSHIWFIVVVARSIRLLLFDDPNETIYLGDFFSQTKGKEFLHFLIIVYYLLFFASRAGAHISEARKPMLMLKFYGKIEKHGFDSMCRLLTPTKFKNFRIVLYSALQFYFIGIPIIALSLFVLCITFALQTSTFYLSIYHSIWFVFWVIIITGPLALNIYSLFWFYTHFISLITYCSMSLGCAYDLGGIIQSDVGKHLDLLADYLKRQNKILNLIRSINCDIGPTAFVGYIIATFLANFSLFLAIFVTSESNAMKIICFGLAIIAYTNLTLLHFAGTVVHERLMEIRERNFSIQARGVNLIPLPMAVWINSTLERIENGENGISVTHIFVMRQSSFLFFVLENSGILMMFVSNFVKS